ncbi:MAG: hypothetical protein NTW03_04970 [Verrucomicrobia bacterium]|nr:hypothetical protein [Verrucomicrobiota bacterium]
MRRGALPWLPALASAPALTACRVLIGGGPCSPVLAVEDPAGRNRQPE